MNANFLERIYGIRTDVVTGTDGLPRVTPLRGTFKNAHRKCVKWPNYLQATDYFLSTLILKL